MWIPYSPSSFMGGLLGYQEEFTLPYLVDGAREVQLESGELVEYDARSLCLGILVAAPSNALYCAPPLRACGNAILGAGAPQARVFMQSGDLLGGHVTRY